MDKQNALEINLETEAKYHLPATLAPAALACLRLAPYALRLQKDERQQDTLLDTSDHAFFHRGYALRLRRTQSQLVLTLKRPGQVIGSVHIREELEAPVDKDDALSPQRWPPTIAKPVLALIGEAPVLPLVELHTHRETWRVERAGQLVAELVVDSGALIADGATADIEELEVELKGEGTPRDLERLDRRLRRRLSLTPEPDSKFARGMALLEATAQYQGGFIPVATAGQRLLTVEAKKLRKHGEWLKRHSHPHRLSGDPEKASDHIHKLRVMTRRLRIALELVEVVPGMRATALQRLSQRLQRLGHVLGALRDGEIVQQRLEAQLRQRGVLRDSSRRVGEGVAQGHRANTLMRAARMQRRSAQSGLHAALQRGVIAALADDLDRVARRLRRLERATGRGPAVATSAPVVLARQVAGGMLWQRYEAVERLGVVAMRAAALPDDRHRLRRAVKRLRYTLEEAQAARLTPDMSEQLLATVIEAQNHLGDLQDDTLVLRSLHDDSIETAGSGGDNHTHGAERAHSRTRDGQPGIVDAIADETRASLARGVAAFWPLWERLSGAQHRAALAETIARL